MGFGSRLKEARIAEGFSRDELSQLLGVTRSAISNYENEFSHPKTDVIYKLFDVLNVDANYLFQDDAPSIAPKSLAPATLKIGRAYELAPSRDRELVDHILEPYMESAEKENACLSEGQAGEEETVTLMVAARGGGVTSITVNKAMHEESTAELIDIQPGELDL